MGQLTTYPPAGKKAIHLKTRRKWRFGVNQVSRWRQRNFSNREEVVPFYYSKKGNKHFIKGVKSQVIYETLEKVLICMCGCNTIIPQKVYDQWKTIQKLEAI